MVDSRYTTANILKVTTLVIVQNQEKWALASTAARKVILRPIVPNPGSSKAHVTSAKRKDTVLVTVQTNPLQFARIAARKVSMCCFPPGTRIKLRQYRS